MTAEEFSNKFDTLAASYDVGTDRNGLSQYIHGVLTFDEFEKSAFLTQAEKILVKNIYHNAAFEKDEKARRELEMLLVSSVLPPSEDNSITLKQKGKFEHTVFNLPYNVWYIVYEQIGWATDDECLKGIPVDVVPVSHDDYSRIIRNPFRGPTSQRALRLDRGERQVEIVTDRKIGEYLIRYVAQPSPIVTANLGEVSIDGVNTVSECLLSEELHDDILELAVKLAIESRVRNNSNN